MQTAGDKPIGAAFGEVVERLRRSTVQLKAQRRASGSGVIWSGAGRIVTNAHVIEGSSRAGIEVELWDGHRLAGQVVSKDLRRDLAVVQVEGAALPAATIGDSSTLRAGELIIAVGNPLGFIGAASTGVIHGVSGLDHRLGRLANRSWVVSQLRLAPGNSGGPLANARGEVIGINTMISGGLAFAIPSRAVTQCLAAAPLNEPSGLGLVVRPVLLSGRQTALVVLEVVPHSAAEHASLVQGDVLVGAHGKQFQAAQDLELAIEASQGGVLPLQFRRSGSENVRTVAVQMAVAPVRAA